MNVKTKLAELLEEKGMKQADLSRITGIPTSLISNYLKGIKSPSLSNAVALASALNVTVDDLAGLSSDDTPSFKGKSLMLGEKIKDLRKRADMKQADLADTLNVARTAISNWESDINKPNVDLIAKMCYIFNVSPNYFFDIKIDKIKNSPEPAATDSGAKEEEIYQMLKRLVSDLRIDLDALTDRQRIALEIISNIIADNF